MTDPHSHHPGMLAGDRCEMADRRDVSTFQRCEHNREPEGE